MGYPSSRVYCAAFVWNVIARYGGGAIPVDVLPARCANADVFQEQQALNAAMATRIVSVLDRLWQNALFRIL